MGAQRFTPPSLVTREVRWFHHGALPAELVAWFAGPDGPGRERRVDTYDLDSALDGVGRKQRGRSTIDTKVRLDLTTAVELAPQLVGHVEDWEKTSGVLLSPGETDFSHAIAVSKNRLTRRFVLDRAERTGCEAELVDIESGGERAWSLCFETFGDPALRGDALRHGIDRLLEETPLPPTVDFDADHSLAYPDWIASRACQAA